MYPLLYVTLTLDEFFMTLLLQNVSLKTQLTGARKSTCEAIKVEKRTEKILCMYFSIIISLYRGFIAQKFFVIAIEHFCMKNFAIKRIFQGTQLNIRYIEFFVITKFVISKFHCTCYNFKCTI